jgi:uncharacterized membrane protein
MNHLDKVNEINLAETFFDAIKYVVTFENPMVTILVIILVGLFSLHIYKERTSTEYAEKVTRPGELKVFGFTLLTYPKIRDILVFFSVAVCSFVVLIIIFMEF